MGMKHRTQVLLDPRHHAYLRQEAEARKCSLSGALRRLIDDRMTAESQRVPDAADPVLNVAGTFRSGRSDTASRDEEILYGREA